MMGMKLVVGAALAGVLNTLWVGLAIAAVAWALGRYPPRTNAATRHLLGWAALALVLLVPFAALEREPVRDVDSVTTAAVVEAPSVASTNAPDATLDATPYATPYATQPLAPPRAIFPLQLHEGDWLAVALGLWMAFGFLQMCRIALSFVYLRKLKRGSHAAPDALVDRFQYWIAACGIRRPVRLLVSERIQSPMATGFRHPAVIVPSNLFAHFDAGELDHVLLHELAHVARLDDWSNLFARCLSAVVGLRPVAAWTLRQIARERELMARVLPAHAEAAKKGSIELSATPFYHPILPLVCDTNAGAVSSPGLPLPQNRFKVKPGTSWGHPAASTASRPMHAPWSPTPLPLPMPRMK